MTVVACALAFAGCSGASEDASPPTKSALATPEAASGLLADVYAACSTGDTVDWKAYGSQAPPVGDVIQLSADGKTISVTTPRTQGEDLGNLGYYVGACILGETGAPAAVVKAMERANLSGSFDEHSEVYESSKLRATITFDWYDHESDRGTSWDATFAAVPR